MGRTQIYRTQLSLFKLLKNVLTTRNIKYQSDFLSNRPMEFPCLDRSVEKSKALGEGPEPIYSRVQSGFEKYQSKSPLFLDYGSMLNSFELTYETWGTLNQDKSNAILLHTGLSASSHAKSQPSNEKKGWWEDFIGAGKPLDTSKYFVICTNVLGGCYGSSGPLSINPEDEERYATRFPVITVNDMTRAQNMLVKEKLGIKKLYASVGSSLGGMQSFAYATEFPDQVEKIVSISGCVRSHPYSIAMRFSQRQVLMNDSNWNRGFYYDKVPPHVGMKLARAVATITYRSGPEWESRFARARLNESYRPVLCADFLVETYLEHQGEKFSLEFDPNSFLYISKAMDLFDLGATNRSRAKRSREQAERLYSGEEQFDSTNLEFKPIIPNGDSCESIPAYQKAKNTKIQMSEQESKEDLRRGLENISNKDCLVVGVKSDILFPSWQQKEAYDLLVQNQKIKGKPKNNLVHVELPEAVSQYGHDTFLLDLKNIGRPVKDFLD